ncbi:hypothetical protein BIW11_13366 [Tropilaelaps mercedesae]|uniref:Uncharacterized protein n=1 Tax=Tropilaelaps mercedesae TaxID=418985 RepID=A0A1V9X214_9ACAR|nr:hypothetical protein BIW11_13366 [Tropilaelaps mercedesae]
MAKAPKLTNRRPFRGAMWTVSSRLLFSPRPSAHCGLPTSAMRASAQMRHT